MPKVHHVKARKDYPDKGIVKGQMCYVWSLKTGPRSSRNYRQLTPPKRSQLTTSDFLSQLYDIFDETVAKAEGFEDIATAADNLRDLGQEQQDKFDNMPEGLQQGDTGQMLEARANGCESAAEELQSIADDLETKLSELDDEKTEYDRLVALWEEYDAKVEEAEDGDEIDEPEELRPDERDFDEERRELINEAISEAQEQESVANDG